MFNFILHTLAHDTTKRIIKNGQYILNILKLSHSILYRKRRYCTYTNTHRTIHDIASVYNSDLIRYIIIFSPAASRTRWAHRIRILYRYYNIKYSYLFDFYSNLTDRTLCVTCARTVSAVSFGDPSLYLGIRWSSAVVKIDNNLKSSRDEQW